MSLQFDNGCCTCIVCNFICNVLFASFAHYGMVNVYNNKDMKFGFIFLWENSLLHAKVANNMFSNSVHICRLGLFMNNGTVNAKAFNSYIRD